MDHILGVHVGESKHYLMDYCGGFFLWEMGKLDYSVIELTSIQEFWYYVVMVIIFKEFKYPHYLRMSL